jgi:hypothetical protein
MTTSPYWLQGYLGLAHFSAYKVKRVQFAKKACDSRRL